jgi:hypothetical protein
VVRNSQIEDTVIERDVQIDDCTLNGSLIGERSRVSGVKGKINVGDDSQVTAQK